MCHVLKSYMKYGRNLKSKVWYTVLNVAIREENVEALKGETTVFIDNLPVALCVCANVRKKHGH